jgi:hypothetical protein
VVFRAAAVLAAHGAALLAGAGDGLDGDPDGDPVDPAGMSGGTQDQGVGAGGDPERFGDPVEQ